MKKLLSIGIVLFSLLFEESANAVIETTTSKTLKEQQQKDVEMQKQIDALKLEIRKLKGEDVKIKQSIENKQDKEPEQTDATTEQTNSNKEGIIGYVAPTTRNAISKWFHTYLSPEQNPIFLGKKHMLGITYGFDADRRWAIIGDISRDQARIMHTLAFGYSSPFKFFCFNGRYTLGLFTWLGHDPKAVGGTFKYRTLGMEFIPEIIIGTKTFYFTAGAGISYVFIGKTSYESTNRINNTIMEPNKDGLTYFNWVLTASIGHRFDNGLAIELLWKHYSNGQLGEVNYDLNFLGLSIRYAFTVGTR